MSKNLTEQLEELHTFTEVKKIRYKGLHHLFGTPTTEEIEAQQCTVCKAIKRNGTIYYEGCDISSIYPASWSPCLCTRRKYAEAHGIEL